MSLSDKTLDSQITYLVSDNGIVNAYARKVGGKREIRVNTGLIASIDFMAIMEAAVLPTYNFDCEGRYVAFLSDQANANGLRVLYGQTPSKDLDPFTYLHSHPADCPQITLQQMAVPGSFYSQIRNIALTESMKWVLLHEFAHHKYADVDSVVDKATQRMREQRADEYAFDAMLRPPETPLAGIGIITLFAAMENLDPNDRASTHPSAVKRLKMMIQSSHTFLNSPEFQNRLEAAGPKAAQGFREAMKQLDQVASEPTLAPSR